MRKNNKGFTLSEVLVSVVIAGMIVAAVATVFIRYRRLENRCAVKENILREIKSLYGLFTGSPADFNSSLETYYGTAMEFNGNRVRLYFDSGFTKPLAAASGNFLEIEYTLRPGEEGSATIYGLKITPYSQMKPVRLTGEASFTREIRVGGEP